MPSFQYWAVRIELEPSFCYVIFLCSMALIIPDRKPNSLLVQFNSPTAQEKALPKSEITLCAVLERAMGTHTPAIALSFPYECFSSRPQVSAVSHLPLFARQGEKGFYSPFLSSKLTVNRVYRTMFTFVHYLSTS